MVTPPLRTSPLRQKQQRIEDQVRVAYGAVAAVLAVLPADYPLRTQLRDRARSLLLVEGLLTEAEFSTLSVSEAILVVCAVPEGIAWR